MTSHDLRSTLQRLADSADPLPVDADLWRRGRAARRRGQVLVAAAVLAIIASVTWSAVLLGSGHREARTASTDVVPGGAIPSRIVDPGELPPEADLAVGRASVAFFSASSQAVVIGATDGSYHALDLPDLSSVRGPLALSPDGTLLAWRNGGRVHVLDLTDGTSSFFPASEEHAAVTTLAWVPDSERLLWNGSDDKGRSSGGLLPVAGGTGDPIRTTALRGIPAPDDTLTAVTSRGAAARFVDAQGKVVDRRLPADLYPSGANVAPLGWADDHVLLAEVDAPAGSYVEGRHLTLFTSPDRPESEWTYRIVMRDVPDVRQLNVAADLVPDLDGTSSQQLTHDFGDPARDRDVSWLIGLGVAAAIAVLLALRWFWRRLLG